MRIFASDTELNRYITNPLAGQKNAAGNMLGNRGITKDNVTFSKYSRMLPIDGQTEIVWDSRITNSDDNKAFQIMDQSISAIGNIIERVKSLTKLATDKSLSDEDRIEIQIDLVSLNKDLNVEKRKMNLRMAGQSEKEITENIIGLEKSADWLVEMLKRARERVLNGEEWDVAEVYQEEYRVSSIEVQTPEGRQFFNGEGFELPANINPKTAKIINHITPDGGSMVITDDTNVPTVSAILAGIGMPIVMDAQSAKDALPKISAQLEDLMAMKKELASAVYEARIEEFPARQNETSQLLQSLETPQGNSADPDDNKQSLTVQTLIGEMVYVDGDKSNPVLRNPKGVAGKMFAKLAKFFSDKLGKFSGTVIRDNGTYSVTLSCAPPKINGR